MICPLMSPFGAETVDKEWVGGREMNSKTTQTTFMMECQKQNCAFWIKVINPQTGTAIEDCSEVLKTHALCDIVIELRRRPL